jgi:3-phytase
MVSFFKNKGKWAYFPLFLVLLLLYNCSPQFVRNKEARDDTRAFKAAKMSQSVIANTVYPLEETTPVSCSSSDEDAADDPAIWYNEETPSLSVVYGSNKIEGIHAYNLKGKELQFIACGRINNIDVRQDVMFLNQRMDILAGSNRTDRSIDLFRILPDGSLDTTMLGKIGLGEIKPYGFCLGKSENNLLHIYVNDKKGSVLHFSVNAQGDLSNMDMRRLSVETQPEGMVVDDLNNKLYIGEEQKGIWEADAFDTNSNRKEFFHSSTDKNPNIRYDIEGLALLPPNYLVASSQGNFSYCIFDIRTKKYLSSYKVMSRDHIDGVEETDGIEILAKPLNGQFSHGVFIVQDGFNYQDTTLLKQNFKLISLEGILSLLEKPLN